MDRSYGPGTGETWELRGNVWKLLNTASPPNVFDPEMVFDGVTGQFIRFGGWNGERRLDQTWVMRENGWMRIGTGESPSARNHAAMVFDPVRQRVQLYGGHDGDQIFGDLWALQNGRWSRLSGTAPLRRIANGH